MSAPDTLIATLTKNTREQLRVSLGSFNGVDLLYLRVWFDAGGGEYRPGKSGVAVRVGMIPELLEALKSANEAANGGASS